MKLPKIDQLGMLDKISSSVPSRPRALVSWAFSITALQSFGQDEALLFKEAVSINTYYQMEYYCVLI